jgi:hypothetical protein
MSELRKKVIKLAHDNPKLRPHLLPLLKEAATATLDDMATVIAATLKAMPGHGNVTTEVIPRAKLMIFVFSWDNAPDPNTVSGPDIQKSFGAEKGDILRSLKRSLPAPFFKMIRSAVVFFDNPAQKTMKLELHLR